jgi:integrating conjugative element protein (TIGR03749 family)
MSKIIRMMIACILCVQGVAFASTLVFEKAPLNVVLPVGQQRYISFPEPVAFRMDDRYGNLLSVEKARSVIYFTAGKAFQTHQFVVKTKSNKVILLNISASKKASDEPITVVYPDMKPKGEDSNIGVMKSVGIQALIRYAMQQYYAPKRLLHSVAGIATGDHLNSANYPLFASGEVSNVILQSFTSGDLTVTAVYVKNNLPMAVDLKMNAICGQWVGASFFPQSRLTKANSEYDNTMLFLVSHSDFFSTYQGSCGLSQSSQKMLEKKR